MTPHLLERFAPVGLQFLSLSGTSLLVHLSLLDANLLAFVAYTGPLSGHIACLDVGLAHLKAVGLG